MYPAQKQFFYKADLPRSYKHAKVTIAVVVAVMGLVIFAATASASAEELSRKDHNFLIDAAQAGNLEVRASKIALAKTQNPSVKEFANTMVEDHTKVGDELHKLAAGKGLQVPTLTSKNETGRIQREKINLLGVMNGMNFDRHYSSMIGVSAHKDTIKLFRKAAEDSSDPDIKQFATATLPSLEHHLQMAEELDAKTHTK
jgi:putative membrane protein